MSQAFSTLTLDLPRLINLPSMPGQRMDPNQASTITSRRTIHPSSGNTAIASEYKLINAEQMDAGVIDVDPEYQREVVWTGK